MEKVGIEPEILGLDGAVISTFRSHSLLGMSYHLFCVSIHRDGFVFKKSHRRFLGSYNFLLYGMLYFSIEVHPWLIHVNVWQKPLQYCKVISLQLK